MSTQHWSPNHFLKRIIFSLLAGTVPATYASFGAGISIAFCPNIFGPLPWNQILFAETAFYLGAWRNPYVYGTSIGLDRPMASILNDVKAALNPNGTALAGWTLGTTLQPCAGYNAVTPGRPTSSIFPGGFPGITCGDGYTAPALSRVLWGGISQIVLTGFSLGGSLPVQLRELRTANNMDFTCDISPRPSVCCSTIVLLTLWRASQHASALHSPQYFVTPPQ